MNSLCKQAESHAIALGDRVANVFDESLPLAHWAAGEVVFVFTSSVVPRESPSAQQRRYVARHERRTRV
jgi:hypothetical protein